MADLTSRWSAGFCPYCRVFRESVSLCDWMDRSLQGNSLGTGFQEVAVNEVRTLVETNLLSPFGQSLAPARHAREYYAAVEKAVSAAANPAIGLTIVHLPATHVPYFFDRFSSRATRSNTLLTGYPDGLVLADSTLARIRRAMEDRNLWEGTAVLLSSDHSFRHSAAFDGKIDHRVPFLLKMPHQRTATNYEPAFNTVLSAEVLWAVLSGEKSVPAQRGRRLDRALSNDGALGGVLDDSHRSLGRERRRVVPYRASGDLQWYLRSNIGGYPQHTTNKQT